MAGLTDKQRRFCEEYIKDSNGTQAATRAGFSPKTANEQASRLLANVTVRAYLSSLQAQKAEEVAIDTNWILKRFKEISDRCMQAKPVMMFDGEQWVESGEWKFDANGANKATENLAKHLGFYEKDNSQLKGPSTFKVEIVDPITE